MKHFDPYVVVPPKKIKQFNLEGWAVRKHKDQLQAIADLQAAVGNSSIDDDILERAQGAERSCMGAIQNIVQYAKPIDDYPAPRSVDMDWFQERILEVNRQRVAFATYCLAKLARSDAPFPSQPCNQVLQALASQCQHYKWMERDGINEPQKAAQIYVREVEELLQVLLCSEAQGNNGMFSKAAKKVRQQMMEHYKRMQVYNIEKSLGLDFKYGDRMANVVRDDSGWIGAMRLRCITTNLEVEANTRRAIIDENLRGLRQRKFYVTKNWYRIERSIWGRALMAIAQAKRWNESGEYEVTDENAPWSIWIDPELDDEIAALKRGDDSLSFNPWTIPEIERTYEEEPEIDPNDPY